MAASIRYATADDGARIAYSVQGTGPKLVECNGFWNSFGNENPWSRDAWAAVRTDRTLIRFDARGIGLSERDPPAISHELMVSDLECVVDAADVRQFALWGGGVSVPSAIAFAVRHPNRVERLVLTRGVVRAADIMPRDNLVSLLGLIRTDWELASRLFADFETREVAPDYGVPVTAEIKRNISASTATRWLQGLYDSTDVTDIVSQVQAPTLVLHRIEDSLFPFAGAQEMAARIPHARLVALPGKSHLFLGDDVPQAVGAIVEFLNEGASTQPRTTRPRTTQDRRLAATLATVLFTDIVGHTEMMQRLGDTKGRDVLREHERITRELLREHGGTEVKTMGDGFMASFSSVTSAVECAIALQHAFADFKLPSPSSESLPLVGQRLRVRAGLNAGEPIEEDGDLFGATVILASRIAAKAGPGEILVPDTVRSLLFGKNFLYTDRGEFVPKGFDDAVHVYEVRWQQESA
jgi:class 3 adenylate cyclase/pimeloyl-ACP methyl ester carboxylesterase